MNFQQERKDQSEQPAVSFMGIAAHDTQAEELLATLRQCFLFNNGRHDPMRILGIVEDNYPETETDCDMLRLSLRMARDMGTVRIMSMRVHHLGNIFNVIETKASAVTFNS